MTQADTPPSRRPVGGDGRLSLFHALGWVSGVTVFVTMLLGASAKVLGNSPLAPLACQAIGYVSVIVATHRLYAPRIPIRQFLGLRRTPTVFYLLAVVLGLSVEGPSDFLLTTIIRYWPIPGESPLTKPFLSPDATVLERVMAAVTVVVGGPLLEELLFRGALYWGLLRRYRAALAVTAISFLFALAHVHWQMYLPIALVGLVLGLLRWASGSVGPSFLLHASFNAVGYGLMVRHVEGEPLHRIPVLVTSLVATVTLLGLVYYVGRTSVAATLARAEDA